MSIIANVSSAELEIYGGLDQEKIKAYFKQEGIMFRKNILTALLISITMLTGNAIGSDNASIDLIDNNSSLSNKPSYFEGSWVGVWRGWISETTSQDITINISRKGKDDKFTFEYSWGPAPTGSGFNTFPGSLKAKGKEEGDQFIAEWKNKEGRSIRVTLIKQDDNKVKAIHEKSGPYGPKERPSMETYLKRK